MLVPIVTVANLDLLLELSQRGDAVGDRAGRLADETAAIARRDFARYVAPKDAWEDTFAIWCVSRSPRVIDLLHPLVLAALTSYSAGHAGPVHGLRYPYYDKPLVTASAQLATVLLAMGTDLALAAELAKFVGAQRHPVGGWGDDPGRQDPLTSLIAADLLACTDPSFDPSPTLAYFATSQGDDGLWRALGPEAPWLTSEILAFASGAHQASFAERFRWPHRARSALDHKTGIPFFQYFSDLAVMFASLPGLAASRVQLAFIDLIGFRAFNNRHGQDAGDEVLRLFATHMLTIPSCRAVRDGGDEFLVVGAPERAPMERDLRAFMDSWRSLFRLHFGPDADPVAPRIVIGETSGTALRQLRQELGRRITALKELPSVGPEGILATVSE
jgi:GGDEF domain-containing protein